MTIRPLLTRALPLGLTTSLLLGGLATAQDVKISKPVARGMVVAAQPTPLPPGQPGQPGQPPNSQPGQPPMNPMGQPGDKPAGAADTSKPVSRSERPKPMANPDELKVRPDEEGKVRFNFHGQPWPEILQWLAEISNQSLDWQELPGDYLNLATQRAYSVEEARDMINRHLLDRGYTVLVNGEVLTVVNIKKLDPSLVPRVRPEDLAKRMPHEFVKVSFSLETMLAEEAAEEFKPMLSPNGKLTPLKSTNRVEGMDAVANLVEIYNVVSAEESTTGQEQLIKEFVLEHTRAADIAPVLYDLLGLDRPRYLATRPNGGGSGGGGDMGGMMQMMQQMQQQFQQQMQQMQQNQGGAGGKGSSAPKKVQLILNPKKNSIVANAPADKMAIIIQAVKTLDVPNERADSLLMNNSRMQIYRLVSVDPEPIIQMLEEMGNLDPTTVLRVDKSNQSIIAYASLADQLTIKMLVTKLDGSGRRFEVIKLRRLPADYVAGTIDFMMNEGDKDKNSNNRNPFRYDYYMPFGLSGSGSGAKDQGKFRVDADVENNRLLLWANEIELQEIENLLAKLGEIPSPEAAQETTRVLDIGTPEDAELLLERLQQAAPQLVPNQIRPRVLPRRITPKSDEVEAPAAQKRTPALEKEPVEAKPASNPVKSAQAPVTKPFRSTPNSKRILVNGRANDTVLAAAQETAAVTQVGSVQADVPAQADETEVSEFPREELLAAADLLLEEEATDVAEAEEESATGETLTQPQAPSGRTPATDDEETPAAIEAESPEAATEDADPMPPPVIRNPNARIQAPRNRQPRSPSAINITVSPDGKLILDSEDTQALDVLEELAAQMAPPRRDFKVFHLKNPDTWAYGVVLNLEKYFGVDKDKKGSGSGFEYSPYFGIYPSSKKDDGARSLSKRRPLKFISDTDSHTILVTGADPAQLKVIEELINIYDQPPETDEKALRQTQIFQIRHSKASVIANAIKEVYRDLLSANDPALQQNNKKDETQKSARESYTYIYGGASGSDSEQPESPIKFKGLLSIGVDEISNTLIISAQAGLLENIAQVIEALDEAARPTASTFQVVKVGPGLETSVLQQKLNKLLAPKPQPQQQPKGQPGQPGQPQQPQFNGQPGQEAAVAE